MLLCIRGFRHLSNLEDRKYSGWVGERCRGSGSIPIRTVKCDSQERENACRELCASECDKEKVCANIC